MKRVGALYVALILFCLVSSVVVLAQTTLPDTASIENDSVVRGVNQLRNYSEGFAEEGKWEYLSIAWKEVLLRNAVISKIDSALTKINPLFVVLFARDYALSGTLFLAFLLWLSTAMAIDGYFIAFIENRNYKTIAAFAGTIALAHLQIFNYLSVGLFKVIFYKSGWAWSLISTILVFAAIYVYFYLNRMFAARIKKGQEEARRNRLEGKTKQVEAWQKGAGEGI